MVEGVGPLMITLRKEIGRIPKLKSPPSSDTPSIPNKPTLPQNKFCVSYELVIPFVSL